MKKIAIVAHGLNGGGAERVASILANGFTDMGYKVRFVAVYSSKKEYKLNDEVDYVFAGGWGRNKGSRLMSRTMAIEKALREFKADVAISFVINEMLLSALRWNRPIIYSLRSDPTATFCVSIHRILCEYLYGKAYKIVFQTPGARDFFHSKIKQKGVIIGNPLTGNLPYWLKNNHKKTVVTACRLSEQKNLKMLIKAFARFHRDYPDYKLEIYGEGPQLQELKRLCVQLGGDTAVAFQGHSNIIYEVMAQSAMFTLTSNHEGLSNSMLEALAIGVPTICTDCPPGGAAAYIEDGVNGMLVPVNDTEMLYNKMCRLAGDAQLCEKMSQKATEIKEKLEVHTILGQWVDLIENV